MTDAGGLQARVKADAVLLGDEMLKRKTHPAPASRAVVSLLKGDANVSHPVGPSPLLARVQEFLPQLEKANADLVRAQDISKGAQSIDTPRSSKVGCLEPEFVAADQHSESSGSESSEAEELVEVEASASSIARPPQVNMSIYVDSEIGEMMSKELEAHRDTGDSRDISTSKPESQSADACGGSFLKVVRTTRTGKR